MGSIILGIRDRATNQIESFAFFWLQNAGALFIYCTMCLSINATAFEGQKVMSNKNIKNINIKMDVAQ